jgi:hypothetical protein
VLQAVDPRHVPDGELARLGRLRLRAGDADGAVALLRRAVELERRRGDVSANLAILRSLVAEGLELGGRIREAQVTLTMCIDTYEAISAPALVTVPLLVKLARIELALGDLSAAENACQRALATAPPKRQATQPYREAGPEDPAATSRDEAERLLAELNSRARAATP